MGLYCDRHEPWPGGEIKVPDLSHCAPGRIRFWLSLGLCLLSASVWGDSTQDNETELNRLHVQWVDQFWSYLESSETAQFRTASGLHLLQSGDPEAFERGLELIEEVLSAPNPDPASLWLVASDCHFREIADWCNPGGVYEMLVQAAPGNAAALMARFSHTRFANDELLDTESNRQLILKAAEADRFDMYWGRGADSLYEESLNFVELNPVPPILGLDPQRPQLVITPNTHALSASMSVAFTPPSAAYQNTVELCGIQARNQRTDTMNACKTLARILRENGYSSITRAISYAIEKVMLRAIDPDDPQIRYWQLRGQAFHVMQFCLSPRWLGRLELWSETDVTTMRNWAKNIDELGEVKGNRLTAIQEYNASPDDFAVNPADCDKLLDLDDEAMARLVDGQNPYAAWKRMQAEADSQN